MKTLTITQAAIVEAESGEDFERKFNERMQDLAGAENLDYKIEIVGKYKAVITYTETTRELERVEDEFRAKGLTYKCRHCPLHDVVPDGRKKWVPCKYADLAMAHLDRDACEVFYRKLKQRDIVPYEGVENDYRD